MESPMRLLLILTLCAAAGACTTGPTDAPLSDTFGQAFAAMDRQIIPAAVSDQPPEDSGARAVLGVARADRGEPKEPPATGTSSLRVQMVPYAAPQE
jgi:hypothetical protein